MACEQCGFQNRDGTRFCVECGTALALRCPSCSAEYQVGQKFCGECGTPLTGAPTAAPAASAPNAVRKTVTVLFADLGGSTGFGERADAEISRQVLARYHALLQETIDAHAGTVAKFMGDGMMATFGIPEVAEDDARRAVAAGADLQHRFEGFAADVERRHGETLTLRVGINTGEVVIGAGDADLIGDALNVAARLEKACRPGQVLVGEETWRLTRAEVAYEALGEVTVAGRAQPVAIYEVAADADAEPEVAAPFVGRDAEMERLVGVFDEARSEARARLVTVLGSPGVGKTRLSRELCARLGEHGDAASVELRCDRAGEATFAPVAQLIREASGVTDDHDPEVARAAIGALLPAADADHKRVVDVLAGLVGVGPARSVEETFWGVRRLVEATAADRPLVIVIDDIQWAEPLLLDLIEHLAEWVADAAVLVVGLARPELREVRPSLAEPGRPVAAVVVLDGLDASATEALAAGLLGASRLPAGLVDRLPESTDGNPLFVRELVRMLVDDRVIRRRDDGEWELTIDAEAVDVPPTIQSLLGARVERLPAPEREVLEYASVVGAEFSLGALRELAGERVPVVSLLESMRRKEMVEPTGTYLGDEPVYRFHHVLIRDAAYRRLLKTTRAELHERVAVWTDRTAADLVGEHEAATAFHYEQAHRYLAELGALDGHGDELGRRAAELLTTAAQRALGRDDLASAGALSARALALLPDSDVVGRSDLLQMGCECLLASGDGAAAKPLVEELGRSAADDPRLAAWAECFAAQLVGLTDPDGLVAADAQAQAAAEALIELGDGSGQAKAHQVRAGLLARLGRVGDAELELDLALAAARAADDRRRVTAVLGAAPDAALFGPSPVARAGGRCLDVVRLLRITTASPAVEAASNRCQAVLESLRGRFDVSRSMLTSARTALEELGLRHGIAQTELYAGMVEMIAGNPHAAIEPLRAAYAGLGTLGVGADAGQAAALLSIALLAEGDVDEAELMAAESEALAGQNLKTAIGWRVARAEVLAARGDLTAAVELAEEAVAIAAGTDLVIDHADACVALGTLRARSGDGAGAKAAQADAKRLYEQKGATVPAERLADAETVVADPEGGTEPTPSPAASRSLRRVPSNAAAEASRRLVALFTAHRLEECANLYAEDAHTEDRRSITGTDLVGRAGHVATFASAAELGAGETTFETIAVRGDRLVLGLIAMDFADWDVKILTVTQLDAEGRFTRSVWFDDADLAEASAELDEWYVAGEGADDERVLTAGAAWIRAVNAGDLDAIRALAADDFVWVDHRQLGWPVSDVEGFLEQRGQYADVENRFVNAEMDVRGRAVLATTINRAVGPDGGAVDWLFFTVSIWSADGRVQRMETFDEEHRGAALARFDELSRVSRSPRIENAATRAVARFAELVSAGRSEDTRGLFTDDHTWVDRRRTVSGAATNGFDEMIASGVRAFAEVGFTSFAVETIAVRGDRLTLYRSASRTADGREVAVLAITELDSSGRSPFAAWFDPDDLRTAIAELDARYLAGEGAEHAEVVVACVASFMAMNDHDFEAMQTLLSPDYVYVDHLSIGPGALDRDSFIEWQRSYADVEYDMIAQDMAVRGRAAMATALNRALDAQGGVVEWAFYLIAVVGPDGTIERTESFAADDRAAAYARFDELGAMRVRSGPPPIENAATRVFDEIVALATSRRFDEFASVVATDFERVDHRTGVSADLVRGPDAWAKAFRSTIESGLDRLAVESLAVRGERLALDRLVFTSAAGDEVPMLAVIEVNESGHLCFASWHDETALDPALAELDTRYIAGEGAEHASELRNVAAWMRATADDDADPRTSRAENAASRTSQRVLDLTAAGRYEEATACFRSDFTRIDRRHTVAGPTITSAREYMESFRAILEQFDTITIEPVAVRGDRLHLSRTRFSTESGFETVFWHIAELDDTGLICWIASHDEDDLDAALAELDERHLAGEGADHTDILRTSAELVRRHAARDWAALRDLIHPDTVLVDHRRLGWPAGDRDVIVQMWRELVELAPDHHMIVRTQNVAGRAVLTTVDSLGTSDDGGSVAWALHSLAIVDASGRITTLEFFDEDDWDAALARFDELAAEPVDPRTPRVENAVMRRRREWEVLSRAGRFEEARARLDEFFASDLVRVDRRSTVAAPDTDGAGVLVSLEAMYELGLVEDAADPIAVRGERLALYRQVFRSSGGDELVILTLLEGDASDRAVFIANYDETQLTEALDELDARYAAGEGAEHAHLLSTYTESLRAMQAGDLETMAELGSPDFDYVDHRPTSFGALDTGGVLEMAASYLDVARTSVVQKVYFGDRCLIARLWTRGVTTDGAEAEWLSYNVWLADDAGRALHGELFAEDDWDAALARFDELSVAEVTRSGPGIANAASRVAQRLLDLAAAARYDEAADLLRPDFERLDRRRTVTAPPVTSGAEYLESIRAILGLYDTITTEPVAIRGESLYLSRSVFTHDGFETMFWAATELDADGRLRRIVNYDEDDFAAAMAQLDAWYVEGLGAEEAFTIRRAGDYIRSVMPVDGAATLALLHPDVRLTDHQMLGFGAMDFDGLRRYLAARAEQIAEDHEYFQELEVNGSTVLARLRAKAIRPDGFEALYELWTVTRFVAGKMHDADWFGLDDAEAARARFEELAAAPPPADLDNACVRALERLEWVSKFGDAPGAMDPLAPDVVEVDHRSGIGMGFRIEGRDALVENFVEFRRRLGLGEMRREWLAVRGDRHALATLRFVADNGFEVSALQLYEIDPHGRLSSIDNYDVDDLDAAVAELDERYAAGEGAEHAELLRRFTASMRAFSSGDVAEMAALNSPDFEFVDHRLASWGTLSAGGFVKMTRAFDDVARTFLVTRVRVVGHRLVAALRSHGVSREGAEAEWTHSVVYETDPAGRGLRGELFDGADWDAALARFDELSAASPSEARTLEIENDATRAARLSWRLLAEGRFDELPAVAPGFALESRRRFLRLPEEQDWLDALMLLIQQYSSFAVEPLAIRGARAAVVRVVAGDESGNESAWIATLQLDDADRWMRQVNFDEEDEVAAIDLLDEWYIESEGAGGAETLAAHREGMARYHAKDWSGMRAMAAPNFEFVDHRPLPWPMTGVDGLLRLMQERVEQAPDFRSRVRKLFVDARAILSIGDVVGTDEHGGLQQWPVLTVYEIDAAGANRRIEYFAPEQLDAALARFDEVADAASDERSLELENAATRDVGRIGLHLAVTGRFDEYRALLRPDVERVDRRRTVSAPPAQGVDAYMDALQWLAQFDSDRIEPLAVRGERTAAYRVFVADKGGNEVAMIVAVLVDETARLVRQVNFDDDADGEIDAIDQVDEWYVEGEGVADSLGLSHHRDGMRRYHARDWNAMRAATTDDFELVDHRPLGWPLADADGWIRLMQERVAQVPDMRCAVRKVWARHGVELSLIEVMGTDPDGGRFSWPSLQLSGPLTADGRNPRIEYFPIAGVDAAFARFDELAAAAPEPAGPVLGTPPA